MLVTNDKNQTEERFLLNAKEERREIRGRERRKNKNK